MHYIWKSASVCLLVIHCFLLDRSSVVSRLLFHAFFSTPFFSPSQDCWSSQALTNVLLPAVSVCLIAAHCLDRSWGFLSYSSLFQFCYFSSLCNIVGDIEHLPSPASDPFRNLSGLLRKPFLDTFLYLGFGLCDCAMPGESCIFISARLTDF